MNKDKYVFAQFAGFLDNNKFRLKLKRSTYELLQILGIALTDKTPMRELFEKQEIGVPDAQTTPFIPGLLD